MDSIVVKENAVPKGSFSQADQESRPALEVAQGGKDAAAQAPDIPALMAEIRARVAAEIARNKEARPALQRKAPDIDAGSERKAGELLHSEELRNLNRGHAFALNVNPGAITSHRGGLFGSLIVKFKQKLLTMLRDSLFKEYFRAEHEFHSNLVRYLNDLTKYVDARDAANFWELVRKVDVDTTKAMERIERISDDDAASRHASERRMVEALNGEISRLQHLITETQSSLVRQNATVSMLDGAVKGLETLAAQSVRKVTNAIGIPSGELTVDRSYLLFENRFRGGEDEIATRLERYADLFSGTATPVLELGPGRGELQEHFKSRSVPSYGVDSDRAMVEAAAARGFDVRLGDGIDHLRSLSDRTIGGLIAVQVIEHLPHEVLSDLLKNALRAVRSGGKVVFETINPQSMLALSSNYFRDPTHVAPVHPDTVKHQMELLGYKDCVVHYLSPVPQTALLKEVPMEPFMTPRWGVTLDRINHNIRQLNQLLYGYQDYCIVGIVP